MPTFYYPTVFIAPDFQEEVIKGGPFSVVRRLWRTSLFDLATLATKHTLNFPYQVLDVLLHDCNIEIGIEGTNQAEADGRLQAFRLALYSEGVTPFIVPVVANYSINSYSGINSRDSESLREKLPEEMRAGLTSESGRVEAWPIEFTFVCFRTKTTAVSLELFRRAVQKAERWLGIAGHRPSARAFAQAVIAAPLVFPTSQSLLHMWCAIESLFPSVSTEVTFRVALYLAQLSAKGPQRRAYFDRVKKSYKVRCDIAHGSRQEITNEEWLEAWQLLLNAFNAILAIGEIPKEDGLLNDLFG